MKVAVQCNSPLLQRSLEMFLKEHLTSLKQCDIVLRDIKVLDDKKNLYISSHSDADIIKPFSRSQLLLQIENFNSNIQKPQRKKTTKIKSETSFEALENKINILTNNYQKELLKTIKEHYA